jgi:enoyl-[acyl-carrier protein] reductase/trans-2-enoyl-CoA reductase (NAD+)
VNKGLVTQASSAIPVVPLYISLLYKVMKAHGIHENCIEQMWRLYSDRLYGGSAVAVDSANRIRIDDWEMREDVQQEVLALWQQVNSENLVAISDIAGYRTDFYKLFGFNVAGVDYAAAVDVEVKIPSMG